MTREAHAAEETIFAQFDSEKWRVCLENCAASLKKKIVWGRRGHLDLLAVPAFVVVIDRSIIDASTYDAYLQMIEECNPPAEQPLAGEHTRAYECCIIVDDLRDHAVPKLPVVLQLDPSNPCGAEWMLKALELSASTFERSRELVVHG